MDYHSDSILIAGSCWIANQLIEALLLSYRDQLKHDFNGLLPQKRPKHLGVVLPQGSPLPFNEAVRKGIVDDIANLASWSIRSDIWTLTIYNSQEIPTDAHCEILSCINSKLQSLEKPPRVTLSTSRSSLARQEPASEQNRCLQLRLLDQSDGRSAITNLADSLKEQKEQNLISDEALTTEIIADRLNALYGSAPDLIIVFGSYTQLHGYPPWQLRYAEIKTFSANPELRCLHFVQALHQFAKVEMRHGK
ncbi:Decaprenyl diphosphate synthase-like protein [Aspergillus unguis]